MIQPNSFPNSPLDPQDFDLQTFAKPVPRIDAQNLTQRQFRQQHLAPGKPVVVTGLLDGLNWNLDFLLKHLGNLTFPVRQYGRDRYQQDKRTWQDTGSGVPTQSLNFSRYVEMLKSGEALKRDAYLGRCSLKGTPLEAAPQIRSAEAKLGLRLPATAINLWVGPGGHTSCLHYDPMDGTLMQLQGEKRVILFPPSQLYNLYPFSLFNYVRHGMKRRAVYSQVYPDRPDFEAFPRYREALEHCQQTVLKEGEALFLPAGWWHEVTSLGQGVVCSVNRFWHVLPWRRSLTNWSKWRVHLGVVMAAPHLAANILEAIASTDREQAFRKIMQRM
ncbi:cupin-like domain-containing protein [Thermoleptolyngbya sp. C42_A2020_037]|uniref:cupin-like domain-containing protein n=1 Tax=Thermoleptolyngbya sp. C42_A2020_037 TaxID=2747799 RepID=UPI0019EA749B|nr:cupin-like domain-containing protein [Thermoleptolyngbya sp. C42_A2020_037]MBF2084925.1 cupin-like domain-containing protein [Thermoleptolyngbya sp. C42_A2020_037]